MSEHTPHPHQQADHTEPADSTLIDLIAGDPPVPITVWRTARTDADPHTSLPTRLAYRLVAAYSRPGEAVADLTTDHVLTPICAQGGRQHHRAWFTDSSSLIIGPATAGPPAATTDNQPAHRARRAGGRRRARIRPSWSTGSATTSPTPTCPAPTTAVVRPPDDGPLDAATSLVVASWPLHEAGHDRPGPPRLAPRRLRAAAAPRRLPRPRRRRPRRYAAHAGGLRTARGRRLRGGTGLPAAHRRRRGRHRRRPVHLPTAPTRNCSPWPTPTPSSGRSPTCGCTPT